MSNIKKTLIIAEAGVNHNGNMNYAKKLVLIAKKAGADYVKFQTFKADNLVKKNAPLVSYQKNGNFKSQYELLKRLELSENQHKIIINFCKKNKIKFLSTPFDIESCKLLKKLGLKIIKISSGEINNYPLLIEISKFAKKVILSTGMSNIFEIQNAIKVLKKNHLKDKDITILHCTTSYPARYEDVNILAINFLKKKIKNPIGYSDHTLGNQTAIAAVTLGACIVEKHITIRNSMPGPDHQASLEPKKFFDFVQSIRNAEKILGKEEKFLTLSEKKIKKLVRKSIVAKKKIKKGDVFSENNITCKRPEGGISPVHWNKILGLKANFNFNVDDFIILK
jgi:N,N'-diacetyllegionaminate synthase